MSSSEELSALFAAERAACPPSHAAVQGWTRLAADLAANVAPLPVAAGPLKLGLWLVPKWILAGFALGLLGAGAASPWLAPRAKSVGSTRAAVQVAVSKSASAGSTAVAASEASAPTPTEPVSTPEPAHSVAAAVALPSASVSSATTFDAELKLISLAKAELDAHRPAQARAWLSEHAERFPNGVFVTERDALSVLATCQQGPRDATLAIAFAARHPSSPLVERVSKACSAALPVGPNVAAPRASARASFETLPNDSVPLREPINEPSGGQSK